MLIRMQQALQRGEEIWHEILARQPARVTPRLDNACLIGPSQRLGFKEYLHKVRQGEIGLSHQVVGARDTGASRGLVAKLTADIIDGANKVLIIVIDPQLR